jgi:Ni,Fe-hydrogenase maturation factor
MKKKTNKALKAKLVLAIKKVLKENESKLSVEIEKAIKKSIKRIVKKTDNKRDTIIKK